MHGRNVVGRTRIGGLQSAGGERMKAGRWEESGAYESVGETDGARREERNKEKAGGPARLL